MVGLLVYKPAPRLVNRDAPASAELWLLVVGQSPLSATRVSMAPKGGRGSRLIEHRPTKVAAVALANKIGRMGHHGAKREIQGTEAVTGGTRQADNWIATPSARA